MSDQTEASTGTKNFISLFRAFAILAAMGWLAYTVYSPVINSDTDHPFKLGLDLAGGSHLVYEADVSKIDPLEVNELMSVLRDVIERRVNVFGVSEPIVQVESSSFVTDTPIERLVVELPGVSDVSEAVAEIGRTPLLEFKLYDADLDAQQQMTLESLASLSESASTSGAIIGDVQIDGETMGTEPPFVDTGLTGRFFERAEAVLPQNAQGSGFTTSPYLNITFTAEGGDLFADITRANVGQQLGIFLDGEMISAPVINEAITGGRAVVSGSFTPEEVRALAQNLNFGALPVPIELKSTQTIGASLGEEVLQKGLRAGALGFSLVILFMLLWYRLPGLVAGVSLVSYVTIMLALFQYIPVTLTAAGLAGFILSLGMAVDANVLVFERMKEEYRAGAASREAARTGFARAWSAIRDGNITSLLSAIILFWFGTSLVKGFALVFGLGVIVSMFSALVVTRTLLVTLPDVRLKDKTYWSFLLGNGLNK